MKCRSQAVLFVFGLTMASCAEEARDEPINENEGTGAPEVAPAQAASADEESFIDDDGLQWVRLGPIPVSDGKPPTATLGYDLDQHVASSPLDEIVELLRPLLDTGSSRYTLVGADARKYAERMQNAVRAALASGKELDVPGSPPPPRDKVVIGMDDRTNVNSLARTYPLENIAKLDNAGGDCTGFQIVNQHTVATAAHCVGATWHSIQFAAGSGNTANGGTGNPWPVAAQPPPNNCYGRISPSAYVSNPTVDFDYAVLYLHGRNGAWCSNYPGGWFGAQSYPNGATGLSVTVAGYPNAPPSGTDPMLFAHSRTDAFQPSTLPNVLHYYNDTSGAQSGAPVYFYWSPDNDYRVRAVHSGSPGGGVNHGARMNNTMWNFFVASAGW